MLGDWGGGGKKFLVERKRGKKSRVKAEEDIKMKVLKNMRQSGRGEKMGRKWHKGMEEFARKCIKKEQVL